MSKLLQINPQEITVRAMCLIRRSDNGNLNVDYEPVPCDSRISKELETISGEMREWDRSYAESIWERYSNGFPFETFFLNKHENPAERLLREYDQLHMQINNKPCFSLIPQGPHAMWLSHDSVSYIAAQGGLLRQLSLQKSDIEEKLAALNPGEADKLNSAFNRAVILRERLIKCLDEYDAKYAEYIQRVEALVPNIFSRKKYCRDFSGAYSSSELDYDMTPGNQCVIDNLHEYYHALLLEKMYAHYDAQPHIVAYSSRKHGWSSFLINLDTSKSLTVELKTNFGFGRSSYFLSVLRYKDLSAINTPLIIFYNIAHKFELAGYTNLYELSPASYKQSFADAVEYWDEFKRIGEAAFIERHFSQSLIELRDLLHMVSHTSVFLQFTSLDRFNELTSQSSGNRTLYDSRDSTGRFRLPKVAGLNHNDEQIIKSFSDSVTMDEQNQKLCFDSNLQAGVSASFCFNGADIDTAGLVRIGLAHQRLFALLKDKLSCNDDAILLTNNTIPYPGYFIDNYSGFDLIRFRIGKAGIALNLFDRLKSIASVTNLKNVIVDILDICGEIKQQAIDYVRKTIIPALSECQHEKQLLDSQLTEIRNLINIPTATPAEINWAHDHARLLEEGIHKIESKMRLLESNKREIDTYITKYNNASCK